jgi:putative transposase
VAGGQGKLIELSRMGLLMPRQPRLDLARVPQHVVQRGNDRQPCFFQDIDRIRYLDELREICLREDCAVHAYVLMTNHVHLLMTPQASGQVARVMQALGRRYVRYVNDRYHRTGTLWEGRYKACLVDSESYLLRCYRYIELNPVRAHMVASPADYPWSSYASNAQAMASPLIRPHPSYVDLAANPAERCAAYRALVEQAITPDELDSIRLHLQRQHAYGAERFRAAIEAQLSRRAGPAKIGRPRKSALPSESAL